RSTDRIAPEGDGILLTAGGNPVDFDYIVLKIDPYGISDGRGDKASAGRRNWHAVPPRAVRLDAGRGGGDGAVDGGAEARISRDAVRGEGVALREALRRSGVSAHRRRKW